MRVVQLSSLPQLPVAQLFARIERAGATGRAGSFAVELRDPELDARELYELGLELRRRTRQAGAKLIVNDRLDLAMLLGADGVHLGRRSVTVEDARALLGSEAWVSVSAHSVEEAWVPRGASAVVLAPIAVSPGKGPPLGIEALTEARRRMPAEAALVALGGIGLDNAHECLAAGADAVASIRSDLTSLLDGC
jgi:thiamine-phosphate pyrophosphorylase